jgi:hypothetical protein
MSEPAEPPGAPLDEFAAAEEWGLGDWEREVEQPPAPWPSPTIAYVVVLGIGAAGLVAMGVVGQDLAPAGVFRVGAMLVGAAVCAAALLRALLPGRFAGMLALRSRRVDVALYAALGGAALALAVLVPPPTGG